MMRVETKETLDFKQIEVSDKELYDKYFPDGYLRGCEFSFANLYLWGRQNFCVKDGNIIIFSQFDRRSVYPYPVGKGDKKAALDAIIQDARARGIACRITGLCREAKETIETLYPGRFRFHCDEGAFEYVYAIDDLAELAGKKYHGKRNHINRFRDAFPNYSTEELNADNLPRVRSMVEDWYKTKQIENPNGDHHMEKAAIYKAFSDYKEIGMDGLVLLCGQEVLGVTLGSPLGEDSFDVQFEKARSDIQGAYAVINFEFARYIRSKYPNVRYLNREEDMGLEGLRRAKRSYYPHHMIEKCWACLLEEGYVY